jgi:hypothetical protein
LAHGTPRSCFVFQTGNQFYCTSIWIDSGNFPIFSSIWIGNEDLQFFWFCLAVASSCHFGDYQFLLSYYGQSVFLEERHVAVDVSNGFLRVLFELTKQSSHFFLALWLLALVLA